jgi:hypothetical protein
MRVLLPIAVISLTIQRYKDKHSEDVNHASALFKSR